MTPAEMAMLITALGGSTLLPAIVAAIRARRSGAETRESAQWGAIGDAILQARESAAQSRDRADAMEARYDRMTKCRNLWREAWSQQRLEWLEAWSAHRLWVDRWANPPAEAPPHPAPPPDRPAPNEPPPPAPAPDPTPTP